MASQLQQATIEVSRAYNAWSEALEKLDSMSRGCRHFKQQKELVATLERNYQAAERHRKALAAS